MTRVARLASLLVAATLAAAPAPASAQRSRAARERAAQSAQRHAEGKQAYDRGEFDHAIELWRKGYELRDDPVFLYNIGQAYRQKGDHPRAIFYYRAYLREDPRAKNRDDVEARIAELEALIERQQAATERPPAKDPVPPPPEPAPAPEPEPTLAPPPPAPEVDEVDASPGRGLKIGGAVTGGLGVVAAGAGVAFLLRSSSIQSELQTAVDSGEPWSAELQGRESQGRTASTLGWVSLGAGAALLTTGVVLYLTGAQRDARARREQFVLVPQLGPEGPGLAAIVTF